MKELRWRVVYGYSPSEYISIGEDFLEKAKFAMASGKIFNYQEKTIKGSEIKRIEPDVRFYTRWCDSYDYGSPIDEKEIRKSVPLKEIKERTHLADKRVGYIMQTNRPQLLNDINKLDVKLLN